MIIISFIGILALVIRLNFPYNFNRIFFKGNDKCSVRIILHQLLFHFLNLNVFTVKLISDHVSCSNSTCDESAFDNLSFEISFNFLFFKCDSSSHDCEILLPEVANSHFVIRPSFEHIGSHLDLYYNYDIYDVTHRRSEIRQLQKTMFENNSTITKLKIALLFLHFSK